MKSLWSSDLTLAAAGLLLAAAVAAAADGQAGHGADPHAGPGRPAPSGTGPEPNAAGYSTGPIPAWVVPANAPAGVGVAGAPVHYELIDEQVRLGPGAASRFTRVIRAVNDAAGLQTASQIKIEFDPAYQKLTLHRMQIVRGQRRIDALRPERVRVLQREPQLERQIYDGRSTVSIVLDDVRAGDRIEYAYTVSGSNPVFGGRYADSIYAASRLGPVAFFRLRLLAPPQRAIHFRASDSVETSSRLQSGLRETIFQRRSVPQAQVDPSAPGDQWIDDQIQLSEFEGWGEVGRWADGLFANASRPSAPIHQQVVAIRESTSDPVEQLRGALDFVQGQIRYFGVEMGVNSHRPTPADKVLAQRFGDCKDKVALLVAMARDLGFEARPVLASILLREAVPSMLPSPLAFDHAIARVSVGDKVYWLDATRAHQSGPLAARQATGLGSGLVAAPDTDSPVELPKGADELRMEVADVYRADPIAADPRLESRVVYYGELAEGVRESLASSPADEVERQLGAQYLRMFPKARSDGPTTFQDVAGQNAIQVTWHFLLPGYWRFPEQKTLVGDFALWSLIAALQRPDDAVRKKPYRFPYAGVYRHSVDYEFSEDVASRQEPKRVDETDTYFEYHAVEEIDPRRHHLDGELRIPKEAVGVQDWQAFREKSGALRLRLGGAMSIGTVGPAQAEQLKAALQDLEDGIRKGRIKVSTVREIQSRARVVALDAELRGGRLNDDHRAQALVERGQQLEQVGRAADATSDFEEALRLAPASAEAYSGAALNSLLLGHDALAIWQANRAIELAPSDIPVRFTRGYAEYFQKNYQAARDDFAQILKSGSSVDRNYAAIWVYLTDRRSGTTGTNAAKDPPPGGAASGWPYPVLELLQDVIGVDAALQASRGSGREEPQKLCELYFYLGAKYLLTDNRREAWNSFRRSLNTGVVGSNEYVFARRELDSLDLSTTPSPSNTSSGSP